MKFLMSKFNHVMMKFFSSILVLIVLSTQSSSVGLMLRGCTNNLLSVFSHSFYDSTAKINKYDTIGKTKTYTMYLAKNESENCQFVMRARDERKKSFFEISEFTNADGEVLESEIYKEAAVATTDSVFKGKEPDALVPVTRYSTLGCADESNYVYLINVKSTVDTTPGEYVANIRFGSINGDAKYEQSTATVKAYVWNFELPESFTMDTAMGLERYDIAQRHGVDINSQACQDLYVKYYDFLLEHGISAYYLPYDILDSRADKYMSDPRVKSFCIPYGNDDQIRAYYNKLSSNEDWFKKSYFYPIDEPHSPEQIDAYNSICDRLSRLYPGYNMVTPFYTNDIEGVDSTNVEIQRGKSNIICPETVLYSEKSFCKTVAERVASGDKAWWYVCCGPAPTSDYCNLFVQQEGVRHRILFWQQKQYDVTGLLYWSTNYWRDTQTKDEVLCSPWESAWSTPWTGSDTYGDGSLLYNGNKVGVNGPCSSLRLEAVLNGIEDYEYLTMAEDLIGKKATDKIISKVTKDLEHYTYSDSTFAKARIELGKAIENAFK